MWGDIDTHIGVRLSTSMHTHTHADASTHTHNTQFHDLIEAVYRPNLATHSTMQKLFRVGPGAVSLMNMACVAFTTHYNGTCLVLCWAWKGRLMGVQTTRLARSLTPTNT